MSAYPCCDLRRVVRLQFVPHRSPTSRTTLVVSTCGHKGCAGTRKVVRTGQASPGAEVLPRPQCRRRTVRDPDLAEHAVEVDLDRTFGDPQGPSNLLVGHPLADQDEDLALPGAEALALAPACRREQRLGDARIQRSLSPGGGRGVRGDVQFLPPWPPESSPASVPWPLSSTVDDAVAFELVERDVVASSVRRWSPSRRRRSRRDRGRRPCSMPSGWRYASRRRSTRWKPGSWGRTRWWQQRRRTSQGRWPRLQRGR